MHSLFLKLLAARRLLRPSGINSANGIVRATRPTARTFHAPPLDLAGARRPLSAAAHEPRLNRAH
jgi:hypothetical protein